MYEICFPVPPLSWFIECFWFLRTSITPPAQLEEIVFTDSRCAGRLTMALGDRAQLEEIVFTNSRADLVFTFGTPHLRALAGQPDQTQCLHTSNLDALRRYPVHTLHQGQLHLVGVRFRPGGLAALSDCPSMNWLG